MSIKLGDTVRILAEGYDNCTGEVIGLGQTAAVVSTLGGHGRAKIRLDQLQLMTDEPEKDPDTITISREELREAVKQVFSPSNLENINLNDCIVLGVVGAVVAVRITEKLFGSLKNAENESNL